MYLPICTGHKFYFFQNEHDTFHEMSLNRQNDRGVYRPRMFIDKLQLFTFNEIIQNKLTLPAILLFNQKLLACSTVYTFATDFNYFERF